MSKSTFLKEIEYLEEIVYADDMRPVEKVQLEQEFKKKQSKIGTILLNDWKSGEFSINPAIYLLESDPLLHLQLRQLHRLLQLPWVERTWMRSSSHNRYDIFDWIKSISKPKFRSFVSAIIELEQAEQKQWNWLCYTVEQLVGILPLPNAIENNILQVVNIFQLGEWERELVKLFSVINANEEYKNFISIVFDTDYLVISRLARFLNCSEKNIANTLSPKGFLCSSLLLCNGSGLYSLRGDVSNLILAQKRITYKDMLAALIKSCPSALLTKRDFTHLNIDPLIDYLRQSIESQRVGVNILLYGPPGTGKTQLTRYVAKAVKARLYSADTEVSSQGDLFCSSFAENIRLAQRLLSRSDKAMLCVDECENIFETTLYGRSYSKLEINQLMEQSPLPMIWITNQVEGIDPAHLRRFDMILAVEPPIPSQKQLIYQKVLKPLKLSDRFIEQIAKHEIIAQAHIQSASNVVELLKLEGKAAETQLQSLLEEQLKPLGESLQKSSYQFETVYRPELVNLADDNMHDVEQALLASKEGRLLLYGPPGTGKTGFAYYLSEKSNIPLHHTRASDLLDMFVGGTEQNIARVFQQASQDQAILLLDEADSLLTDRKSHNQSWETSQVNELLTQMECYQGILIASTNFQQKLDGAVARRFDFKLKFEYLQPEQAEVLLVEVSNQKKLPKGSRDKLALLPQLTPGDFAIVARKMRIKNQSGLNAALAMLKAEHDYKTNGQAGKMGFI